MAAATTLAAIAGTAVAAAVLLAPPAPGPVSPAVAEPAAGRAAAQPEQRLRPLVPVEILRVIDGDTLEVRAQIWLDQWIVTRVRLRDIDAPEVTGRCAAEAACGKAARRHLASLAAGASTFLTDLGRDKYGGRVLGRIVSADGQDLGRRMLADGHARSYAGRQRQPWC